MSIPAPHPQTFGWIKGALDGSMDAVISQVVQAERDSDFAQLSLVPGNLHQIHGSLMMVELDAAGILAEDLEALCNHITDSDSSDEQSQGLQVMRRGVEALHGYIDSISRQTPISPLSLVDQINAVRQHINKAAISSLDLFSPPLGMLAFKGPGAEKSQGGGGQGKSLPDDLRVKLVAQLRKKFRRALVSWLANNHSKESLSRITDLLQHLFRISALDISQQLWWVASGFVDAVASGDLDTNSKIKSQFARLDNEISRLEEETTTSIAADPPDELLREMLYYIGGIESAESERIRSIQESLELPAWFHSGKEQYQTLVTISKGLTQIQQHYGVKEFDRLEQLTSEYFSALQSGDGEPDRQQLDAALSDLAEQSGDAELEQIEYLTLGVASAVKNVGASKSELALTSADIKIASAILFIRDSVADPAAIDATWTSSVVSHQQEITALVEQTEASKERALQVQRVAQVEYHHARSASAKLVHATLAQLEPLVGRFQRGEHETEELIMAAGQLSKIGNLFEVAEVPSAAALSRKTALLFAEFAESDRRPEPDGFDQLAYVIAALGTGADQLVQPGPSSDMVLEIAFDRVDQVMKDAAVQGGADLSEDDNVEVSLDTDTLQSAAFDSAASDSAGSDAAALDSALLDATALDATALDSADSAATALDNDSFNSEKFAVIVSQLDMHRQTISKGDAASFERVRDSFAELEEESASSGLDDIAALADLGRSLGSELAQDRVQFTPEREDFIGLLVRQMKEVFPEGGLDQGIPEALDLDPWRKRFEALLDEPNYLQSQVEAEAGVSHVDASETDSYIVQLDQDLKSIFVEELGSHIDRLKQQVTLLDQLDSTAETWQGPLEEIEECVHTLAGNCRNLGLDEAAQCAVSGLDLLLLANPEESKAEITHFSKCIDLLGEVKEQVSEYGHSSAPLTALLIEHMEAAASFEQGERSNTFFAGVVPARSEAASEMSVREDIDLGDSELEEIKLDQINREVPEFNEDESEAIKLELPEFDEDEPEPIKLEVPELDADVSEATEFEVPELDEDEAEAIEFEVPELDEGEPEAIEFEVPELDESEPEAIELELPELDGDEAEAIKFEVPELDADVPEAIEFALPELDQDEPEAIKLEVPELDEDEPAAIKLDVSGRSLTDDTNTDIAQAVVDSVAENMTEPGDQIDHHESAELAEEPSKEIAARETETASDVDDDIDEEIRQIFIEETEEILGRINGLLIDWRDNDAPDGNIMAGLRREFHTLKGSAAATGFNDISGLSHNMESLMEQYTLAPEEASGKLLNVLEEIHDGLAADLGIMDAGSKGHLPRLNQMVDSLISGDEIDSDDEPDSTPSEGTVSLVAEETSGAEVFTVKKVAALPIEQSGDNADTQETPHVDEVDTGEIPGLTDLPAGKAAQQTKPWMPAATNPLLMAGKADDSSTSGMLRIDNTKLAEMINASGELGLLRTQLQNALDATSMDLDVLRTNMGSMREGLRELELEAEAQIRARPEQQSVELEDEFDPLQLDRFSRLQAKSREVAQLLEQLTKVERELGNRTSNLGGFLQHQKHVGDQLQSGLMSARMVSVGEYLPRLRYLVRETARQLGKVVEIKFSGGDIQVDRQVIETMMAPFEHMIRNAVVHGIELPSTRTTIGKSEAGTISIHFTQQGSELVVEFSDDGDGLHMDRLSTRAIELGLVQEKGEITEVDLLQVITQPGYSTSETVSMGSGRGVGMDVVYQSVRDLGGSMTLTNLPGKGVSFQFRLPVTLAVTQALLVTVGSWRLAIRSRTIERLVRVSADQISSSGNERVVTVDGREIPLISIRARLGEPEVTQSRDTVPVVLVRLADRLAAFEVDRFEDSVNIVSKNPGRQLASIPEISGVTVLGDSTIVLILDPEAFIERIGSYESDDIQHASDAPLVATLRRVLVVDDSLVVRKVMQRDLEADGLEVETAIDGINALEVLDRASFDIALVDIEMPRMNGYELLEKLRADSRYQGLPVVIITSRSGSQHRQRAMDLGADGYITKPYDIGALDQLMRDVIANKNNIH